MLKLRIEIEIYIEIKDFTLLAVGWTSGFDLWLGQRFLCLPPCPALRPIQPHIQWVLGALFLGTVWSVHASDSHLSLRNVRNEGNTELYNHVPTSSWHGA
jgi:hypothetical protein